MVVFPNVKINLGLNVLFKRPDGYHELTTGMVGVDWCDVLEVVPANADCDSLVTSGIEVKCPPEKNLVFKALQKVRNYVPHYIPPLDVFLHKNVPDGAGLGGGSSDAAFMIKLLNVLFDLKLSVSEMCEIASQIGCDCPFFIENRPAFAKGRGEILTSADTFYKVLKNYKVVIAKPREISIPTALAYSGISPNNNITPLETVIESSVNEWHKTLKNDFEHSVFPNAPVCKELKMMMYECGALYAAMSGSGSAVYGIFEENKIEKHNFNSLFSDCFVHVGNFLI